MSDRQVKKVKGWGRTPIAAPPPEQPDPQRLSPVFCLRYLSPGFTLSECSDDQAAAFVEKLYQLCQLDWNTITNSHHRGNGYERLPIGQLKVGRPSRATDEVKELHVFRCRGDGTARILGLRLARVFEVYMIDPTGSAYDHGS